MRTSEAPGPLLSPAIAQFDYAPQGPANVQAQRQLYSQGYAKLRYKFVLARMIFCAVVYTDPVSGDEQHLFFYKGGDIGVDQVVDPLLLRWAQANWAGDYNMAFWEIRAAALLLAAEDSNYAFRYDAGLVELQQMLGQSASA